MGGIVLDESLAVDVFDESLAIDGGLSVERDADSSAEAFSKLLDLAITVAMLALFVVLYGAFAYGIYVAWVALS